MFNTLRGKKEDPAPTAEEKGKKPELPEPSSPNEEVEEADDEATKEATPAEGASQPQDAVMAESSKSAHPSESKPSIYRFERF